MAAIPKPMKARAFHGNNDERVRLVASRVEFDGDNGDDDDDEDGDDYDGGGGGGSDDVMDDVDEVRFNSSGNFHRQHQHHRQRCRDGGRSGGGAVEVMAQRTSELTLAFEGEVYVFPAVTPEKVAFLCYSLCIMSFRVFFVLLYLRVKRVVCL